MALRVPSLLTAVRCEAINPPESNGTPNSRLLQTHHRPLSVPKPSWVVRTESNVRKEKIKKPVPPCAICGGSGRVDCHQCCGKGRTNCSDLMMLPKGEWPKW